MKYIVEYNLAYDHIVRVGIEADSEEAACARAGELFNTGTIWDNTEEIPLLYDDFEERDDNTLTFTAEPITEWPEKGACVKQAERNAAAHTCARLLAEAYDRGERNGGSIDWSDVDLAYEQALKALTPK